MNVERLVGTHLQDQPKVSWHRGAWSACLVFLIASLAAWACISHVDEQTRAAGSVIASSRSQIVQSIDGGALQQLLVKEGDAVAKGQLLAVLDPSRLEASTNEIGARTLALRATIARLEAETRRQPISFPEELAQSEDIKRSQRELFENRQRSLREDLESIEATLELATRELHAFERLAQTGDAAETEVLRARRQVNDLKAQRLAKRNKYFQDAQTELTKAREDLATALQTFAQRADALASTKIHAPLGGIVKNVRVTTLGGVLRPGEELLQIVPTDETLIVEAKVRPQDVAFLRAGLPASIKLDSYDSSVFGSILGEVSYISADTLKEDTRQGEVSYYRVHVRTLEARPTTLKGTPFEIIPGMTANVDIRTGTRTVAEYLLKPLRQTLSQALTER